MDDIVIADLERALFAAWPAGHTETVAGWIVRATAGGYNRANSVWPLRFDAMIDPEAAIDEVEAFYRRRALPPRFQVLEIAAPPALDVVLAKRGYAAEAPTLTLVKAVRGGAIPADVTISGEPTRGWRDLYFREQPAIRARECAGILSRVPHPRAFVTAYRDGVPAAVGLGVMTGSTVAVDCVQSAREHLRRGAAQAVMRGLDAWAGQQGAARLALAVVAANAPARALYDKLAYRPVSGYHYRTLPAS